MSTKRLLVILAGVYTVQSTVGAISFQAMPAILKHAGYRTDVIGLVYLLMLPWVLKFIWSPYIERYRLKNPAATRNLLVAGNVLTLSVIFLLSFLPPGTYLISVLCLLMFLAIVCGSIDNAADGFAINNLAKKERGLGNTVQIGSGYAGAIIGGGLFLIVLEETNWQTSLMFISLIVIAVLIFLLNIPNQRIAQAEDDQYRPSLKFAWRRQVALGQAIILIYQLGLRLTQGMTMPFFVDQGVNLSELGFITAFGNSIASLVAVVVAGLLLRHFPPKWILLFWLLLQIPVYLGFYIASYSSDIGLIEVSVLMITQSITSAAAFVALYTMMMGWTSEKQAGVDFSIFQCTDVFIAMVASIFSGWLVAQSSYADLFMTSIVMSSLGIITVPLLLKKQETTFPDKKPITHYSEPTK